MRRRRGRARHRSVRNAQSTPCSCSLRLLVTGDQTRGGREAEVAVPADSVADFGRDGAGFVASRRDSLTAAAWARSGVPGMGLLLLLAAAGGSGKGAQALLFLFCCFVCSCEGPLTLRAPSRHWTRVPGGRGHGQQAVPGRTAHATVTSIMPVIDVTRRYTQPATPSPASECVKDLPWGQLAAAHGHQQVGESNWNRTDLWERRMPVPSFHQDPSCRREHPHSRIGPHVSAWAGS